MNKFTIISGRRGTGKKELAMSIAFGYPNKTYCTDSSEALKETKGDPDWPEDHILIIEDCHNPIVAMNRLQHANSFHKVILTTESDTLNLLRNMEVFLREEQEFNYIETHVLRGRAIH